LNSKSGGIQQFDPYGDPYRRRDPRPKFTPQELREVIAHAEDLIGGPLDDLLNAHRLGASSRTPLQYPHRLIDLLLRLRKAADRPADALALDVASVAIVEVSAVVATFDEWRTDPAWREFQLAIQDPRHYLYATATLTVASALRLHHPKTEIVASSVFRKSALIVRPEATPCP
jgi:hypothetical protein